MSTDTREENEQVSISPEDKEIMDTAEEALAESAMLEKRQKGHILAFAELVNDVYQAALKRDEVGFILSLSELMQYVHSDEDSWVEAAVVYPVKFTNLSWLGNFLGQSYRECQLGSVHSCMADFITEIEEDGEVFYVFEIADSDLEDEVYIKTMKAMPEFRTPFIPEPRMTIEMVKKS